MGHSFLNFISCSHRLVSVFKFKFSFRYCQAVFQDRVKVVKTFFNQKISFTAFHVDGFIFKNVLVTLLCAGFAKSSKVIEAHFPLKVPDFLSGVKVVA